MLTHLFGRKFIDRRIQETATELASIHGRRERAIHWMLRETKTLEEDVPLGVTLRGTEQLVLLLIPYGRRERALYRMLRETKTLEEVCTVRG
jgi:hypothetical protein